MAELDETVHELLEDAAIAVGQAMKRIVEGGPGWDDLMTALDCIQRARDDVEHETTEVPNAGEE